MYGQFIRKCLLENSHGIYAMMVENYKQQAAALGKPALFRKWLAAELEVPEEKINPSSLSSALQQQKKKQAKAGKGLKTGATVTQVITDSGFTFSKPSSETEQKARIEEL